MDNELEIWLKLRNELMNCNVKLQEDAYARLREHELNMKHDGFLITIHEVFSPEGELLWNRTSGLQ